MSHRVVFTPSGLTGEVDDGITVLEAARRLGVDLDTVCGGRGICGRCQVEPATGTHAKWAIVAAADSLSEPGSLERDYRGARPLAPHRRLGCATTISGDVVIDVPADSQVHRQVVRKDLDIDAFEVDPRFALLYIDELSIADETELRLSVSNQHGITVDAVTPAAAAALQPAAAEGTGAVTVACTRGEGQPATVVGGWPGLVDTVHGIAVDIGSTTVAGHLCELTTGSVRASGGRMNPQIRFGEDLMSRVSYVMMNPGGDHELTLAIRAAIDELVSELTTEAGVDPTTVLDLVLVGNPIMHHLALGFDPTPLGTAPFELATDQPVTRRASEMGLPLPFAEVYVGPCIAGHVGADTAAAVLAEGPHRGESTQLLVDIGTNAEIVLGDRSRLLAASSPTGPAFEGAQISCGQRATTGAIERVRIDRETLEARVKVIGSDRWSDEPGFVDSLGPTGVTGVCGSGIIEAVAEMYLAGIIGADGTVGGHHQSHSARIVEHDRTYGYLLYATDATQLTVTQNDVRAIQLAKAALRAGIDLLIEHAGGPEVADVRLAGAFGAHVSPLHALVLGLVPDCPLDGVRSVGNAAGAGAVQALLSARARTEMEATARHVVKIETATEPRFQELFVAAMAFPHAHAPTPNLAGEVELPEAGRDRAQTPTRRRRRRRAGATTPDGGPP